MIYTALTSLFQFTQDFFTYFGANIDQSQEPARQSLRVSLPDALKERFGKDKMHLVFESGRTRGDAELVAAGSRVFDQMLEHLSDRGALTLQRLPLRFGGGETLMQAVRPLNASIVNLKMAEQIQYIYLFNWRLVYKADDKQEMLFTVALDAEGKRLPLTGEVDSDAKAIDVNKLLAAAESVPVDKNEDDEPLPPKLPPMTRLTELAEIARRFAVYHADVHCVSLEAEIQPRLYKSLNRLYSYYSQQIEEVYEAHDPTGEKRRLLETDLQRKLAEEVEAHRLRVQVDLFSYAILEVPVATADLTLSDGSQEITICVKQDRYSGEIQRPHCHACQKETVNISLDRKGHVTCDACLEQCVACLAVYCVACGIHTCPLCETANCEECSQFCWACGERACHTHTSQCPTCFDTVCHACQSECAACGVRQCTSHLRTDAVGEKQSDHQLICGSCAVRCGGCQQYSAKLGLCQNSGQRFCLNCLGTCVDCGKTVGPAYYHLYGGDRKIHCVDCLQTCPACDRPTVDVETCSTCSSACCVNCSYKCMQCNLLFCSEHAAKIGPCGHIYCTEHAATCAIGHETLCVACNDICFICERSYCEQHAANCELCRCTFCQECVRSGLKLCDTCATIRDEGLSVSMAEEAIASHRDVAPLINRYRWQRAANERYIVYLGQGPFNSGALILTQKREHEEEVLVVRKLSALDRYWRKYR